MFKKGQIYYAKRTSATMHRDQSRHRVGDNSANARFTTQKRQYLDRYSYVASLQQFGNLGRSCGRAAVAIPTK